MTRWYKQQCNLFDREWSNDPKTVVVYVYLHCYAYVQQKMWHGILVRRGSCPTSRAAIMEATGLSEQEVKSRLKKLVTYGEIIIKSTNQGNIITICDYDNYTDSEGLFDNESTSQQPTEVSTQEPANNPARILRSNIYYRSIDNIENRDNNIISIEREKKNDVYEIKKLYNKLFDGLLPEWKRLTKDMIIKVNVCISRYGRQSIDMVFDQVRTERFSLGDNNTGFIASHSFIFELKNYEAYLGRYELRQKKKQQQKEPKPQQEQQRPAETKPQQPSAGSWQDALRANKNWRPGMKSDKY